MIEILPVEVENYILKEIPPYVPQGRGLEIYEAHLDNGIPILIKGPKGVGKTLSVAYFAYTRNIPIIQSDLSEQTRRYDLLGRFILIGNEVKFLLGDMPRAIEIASELLRPYGRSFYLQRHWPHHR